LFARDREHVFKTNGMSIQGRTVVSVC